MAEFTRVPDYGMVKRTQPKVNVARFGDGYEQRVADGINTMMPMYDCKFALNSTDLSSVIAFLEARAGATSFTWIPPGESEIRVVCRDWSVAYDAYSYNILTATFEKVLA